MHPSLVALLHPYYLIFIWFQQMLRKNVKCLEFCPVTMFRSKASVSAHWPVRAQALITVFMATVSGGNVLPCHAAKNARLKGPCWPIWCRNATTIYESMRLLLVAYDLWLYSHDDLMITSGCSWFSRYCSCGHFWWFLYDLWCFFLVMITRVPPSSEGPNPRQILKTTPAAKPSTWQSMTNP